MTKLKETLQKVAASLGDTVSLKGLLLQKARIKQGAGKSAADVLGWDYIVHDNNGVCYSYYAAQPPLIGMTQPVPVPCPLGLRVFDTYEVDFKKAIDIMHSMNCGDTFVDMSLSWPLTPECKEPLWHIRTNLGNQIIIGANSGTSQCHVS